VTYHVEVLKIKNGYLVRDQTITVDNTWAFTSFADMTDFLFKHFDEEVKKD
jgi:hypothetical protein